MKSTIRVDFAGGDGVSQGFDPVIRVILIDSDDTRDKLLKEFFQALGGESSWLRVNLDQDTTGMKRITIYPVRPSALNLLKEEVGNRFDILGPSMLTVDEEGTVGHKSLTLEEGKKEKL